MLPDHTTQAGQLDQSEGPLRVCPICRTGFSVAVRTSKQVYCSPICRNKAHNTRTSIMRTCPVCQGDFPASVSPRRIYCSHECRISSRQGEAAMETRVCPVCELEFSAPKTVRQTYCTRKCRKEEGRRRDRARDEDRARRLGETPRPPAAQPVLAPPPRLELPAPPAAPPPRPATRQQAPFRDPLEPAATRNCPHCDQPITIVALLATPEAARPTIPGRVPDMPLRRVP